MTLPKEQEFFHKKDLVNVSTYWSEPDKQIKMVDRHAAFYASGMLFKVQKSIYWA